jgi:predicted RNase H-like nuclease (RuvC/YqgF family)
MRYRIAVSFLLCSVLALALPAVVVGQSLGDIARKTKAKKKDSQAKVWTNEDFPSGRRPSQPATPAGTQQAPGERSTEQLFLEYDEARQELELWKQTLANYQQQLETQYQRRSEADNDYDRDAFDRSIEASQQVIVETEQTIQELEARVAELEVLTKDLKRPPPKPEEEAGEQQPMEAPPELIAPRAQPGMEQPQQEEGEEQPPPSS